MIPSLWLGLPLLLLGNFIPGYLLSSAWLEDWKHGLGFGECLFVQLLSGLIFNSWLLLLLAELELFNPFAIIIGWMAVCMPLALLSRQRLKSLLLPKPYWSWWAIAVTALLILASFLFARPAESFLVLDDSGIYVLSGIHLAKTGSLFVTDSILASLSPEDAGEVLSIGPQNTNWSRFWGQFFTWGWRKPWVIFGLLDMQRLWCALFTLFLGMYGGLWVAPVFGLVATVGLCFLGRRLFSPHTGLLGALLLTLNFVQIWHARYPVSEMLAQAFVVGGFYLFALFREKRHAWLGALAGFCLGELFLIRIEAVLIGVVFLGLALCWKLGGLWQREHIIFVLALSLALIYAAVHNFAWEWAYLASLWQIAGNPTLTKIIAFGGASLGSVLLIATLKPEVAAVVLDWFSARMWQLLAGLAITLPILALLLSKALRGAAWQMQALTWLTQYWTPLGMTLAAGGFFLLVLRRTVSNALPLVVTALIYFTLFTLNPMVNPIQPWAMRRFVPVILPALALLTAYAIVTLPPLHLQLQRAVQALVTAVLLVAFVRIDRPFIQYTEYSGLGQQIMQMAKRFEERALILFDAGDPSLHLSQPLAYLCNLDTVVLQRARPGASFINSFVESWQDQGKPVYLVLTGGSLDWHPTEWFFVPQEAFTLYTTRIERSFDRIPTNIQEINYTLDIYQIMPRDAVSESRPLAHRLDMAAGEYAYLRGGFYGLETTAEGLTFRWTNGSACLELPRLDDKDEMLRLRVAAGRPSGVAEVQLSIIVNNILVARQQLPSGFNFQVLEVNLPPQILDTDQDKITLELRSDTWVPATCYGQGGDPRELGIVVDWIEWGPTDARKL